MPDDQDHAAAVLDALEADLINITLSCGCPQSVGEDIPDHDPTTCRRWAHRCTATVWQGHYFGRGWTSCDAEPANIAVCTCPAGHQFTQALCAIHIIRLGCAVCMANTGRHVPVTISPDAG